MMRKVPKTRLKAVAAPEGWFPDWGYENDDEWLNRLRVAGQDEVIAAIEKLVEAGCDREYLIALIKNLGSTLRPRLSKADVRKAIEALNGAAEWIECIQNSDLGFRLELHLPDAAEELTADLADYPVVLKSLIALADKRAARTRDDAVASLVRHVRHATGQWHDKQVAMLVSAAGEIESYRWFKMKDGIPVGGWWDLPEEALPKPDPLREEYDAVAHNQWRVRSGQLLEHPTVFERLWNRRPVGAAPQPEQGVERDNTETEPQPRGQLVLAPDPSLIPRKSRPRRARTRGAK